MTSKIIDAYKANSQKFEEIIKINKELKELTTQRDEVITRIIRYYNIIFKNISSKRKQIKIPGAKDAYLVTKAGLTKKQDWQINSINLTSIPKVDFLNELVFLAKLQNKVLFKKVLSRQKYKILSDFLKQTKLLEVQDIFRYKPKERELKDWRLKQTLLLTDISLAYGAIDLKVQQRNPESYTQAGQNVLSNIRIPLTNLTIENISYLEQVFPEAKRLLTIAKKNKDKEIKNLNKFIEYLRKKFENQMVLEELYAKPREAIFPVLMGILWLMMEKVKYLSSFIFYIR